MGVIIMTFAPCTAIKLTLTNEFGQAFGQVKNHLGVLSQPVSGDYLHLSTSIVPDSWDMTADQEIHYRKLVADASKEMASISSFHTGKISVTELGDVSLEVTSPEIEKIISKMRDGLESIGLPVAASINRMQIILQAGVSNPPLSAEATMDLESRIGSSPLKRLENRDFYLEHAQFGAVDYEQDHSTVRIKTDWAHRSMPKSSQAVQEEVQRERAANWVFLGKGSYNVAYKSIDGTEVLKIQRGKTKTDSPERSVRLWNAINAHLPPPARLQTTALGKGWVCPFITGVQAPDRDMADALIDIFNRTGRIVVDATAAKNFVKAPDGTVLCVDIGQALQFEEREERHFSEVVRRKSIVSLDSWSSTRDTYTPFFRECERIYPQSVSVVKALVFIKENRPDILDVTFLKINPTLVAKLAQAYDERNGIDALANFDRVRDSTRGPVASAPAVYAIPLEEINGFLSYLKAQNSAFVIANDKIQDVIFSKQYQNYDENNQIYINMNINNPEVDVLFKEYLVAQRAVAVQKSSALKMTREQLIADFSNKLEKVGQVHQDCIQNVRLSGSEKKFIGLYCAKLEAAIKEGIEAIREAPSPIAKQNDLEQIIDGHVQEITKQVKKIPRTSGLRGFINSICEAVGLDKPFVITNSSMVDKVNQMKERLDAAKVAADDSEQQVQASSVTPR